MSRLHCFTVATRVWGRRRVPRSCARIWFVLLCGLGAARVASAANGTWNSSAQFSNWNIAQDWVSGTVPGTTSGTTNTDTATFNTTSTSTSVFADSNRNLEFITFDATAAAYTINSGPLVLTAGGTIQIASTFTGSNITETFNTPLTLEGNYIFANNATNAGDVLTFAGGITNGIAGTQTLTVSGSDAVNINGAIAGGTGTIALAKNGNNTLTLGGSGDNTGLAVTVSSGTVLLAKSSSASVHSIGGPLLISAGTVQLSGTGGDQISDSATVSVNNGGVFTLAGPSETIGDLTDFTPGGIVQNAAANAAALTINSPNGTSNGYSGILRDGAGAELCRLSKPATANRT